MAKRVENKTKKSKSNVGVKLVASLLVLFTVLGSCFTFIYYLISNI